MSPRGTARYVAIGLDSLPVAVRRTLDAAMELDFEYSVHPATGALLADLARSLGPGSRIGETGTGTGVGVGWMASGAPADSRILSIEIEPRRARAARAALADDPRVEIITGPAEQLWARGPFDLLVLDGGPGAGKDGGNPVDPRLLLNPGGCIVIDDFTPTDEWPPLFNGEPDRARLHWLEHPDLEAEERVVAPDMAVIVGALRPDTRA